MDFETQIEMDVETQIEMEEKTQIKIEEDALLQMEEETQIKLEEETQIKMEIEKIPITMAELLVPPQPKPSNLFYEKAKQVGKMASIISLSSVKTDIESQQFSNKLWVNLSGFAEGNIFAVYPRILAQLFQGDSTLIGGPVVSEEQELLLPSDVEWKTKMYYQLVEKQRRIGRTDDCESMQEAKTRRPKWDSLEESSASSPSSRRTSSPHPKRARTAKRKTKTRDSSVESNESDKTGDEATSPRETDPTSKALKSETLISDVSSSSRSEHSSDSASLQGDKDVPSVCSVEVLPGSWPISDIAKAACLLSSPPKETKFQDEQEMRRVYSLIYDVFRYKNVLSDVLNDAQFFERNPRMTDDPTRAWLLLFDLYHRNFSKHDHTEDALREKLYREAGIFSIDVAIWNYRTRLAAAVSRIRIKNKALKLSQLLPPHLRDEKVKASVASSEHVTAWVNCFKSPSKSDLISCLSKLGMKEATTSTGNLLHNQYRFDNVCPKFMVCRPDIRQAVAQSWLVKKHHLILQDRAFCLGPVIFNRLLEGHELTGNVVQTHINSPRTTAYLANILADNEKIFNLLAFGAGERKGEYDTYFENMGIDNTTIYSEKLADVAPDSELLEHVVAVFATPPNSYSGVTDPIDLVCSRGGDLSILEALTDSDISDESKRRVAEILNEQRRTLKFSISRPQIQFVLYETHSVVAAENTDMVERILKDMNRACREKHAELQGFLNTSPEEQAEAKAEKLVGTVTYKNSTLITSPTGTAGTKQPTQEDKKTSDKLKEAISEPGNEKSKDVKKDTDKIPPTNVDLLPQDQFANVEIPDTDLFEEVPLPTISLGKKITLQSYLKEQGCYLALIQRREVTRFDHKYMIKMAEARGLFGGETSSTKKSISSRQKKRDDKKREAELEASKLKKRSKMKKINVRDTEPKRIRDQKSLFRLFVEKDKVSYVNNNDNKVIKRK